MHNIVIGTVLKPQGIKGEVKVKVYTNDLDRFLRYKNFLVDGKLMLAEKSRVDHQYGYVKFKDINSMNEAELLRNAELEIEEKELPRLPEGEFYISDLMQSKLAFEGCEPFAKVVDVLTQTRNQVIMAKNAEDKSVSFPILKDVISSYDEKERILYLVKKRFDEVALIED